MRSDPPLPPRHFSLIIFGAKSNTTPVIVFHVRPQATSKSYWFNAHSGESLWEDPRKGTVHMEGIVLFAYEAAKDEEITVATGDVVSVVGSDDGSGWIRVKSTEGSHGFMPMSYLEIQEVTC